MRSFSKFEKLNKYLVEAQNYKEFTKEISKRAEGLVVSATNDFMSPRNPLHPMTAMTAIYYRYQAAFRYLDRTDVSNILELGCGHGLPAWLMSDFADVTAIDIDPNTLKVGKALFPEVRFEHTSIAEYFEANKDTSFDLIVSSYVPVSKSEMEIILSRSKRYIIIGHLPSTWSELLFRRQCRYISYNTVVMGEGLSGLESDYFRYHFHIDYLNWWRSAKVKSALTSSRSAKVHGL